VAAVPFLPEARAEFLAVVEQYAAVSLELAEDFVAEVENALARISAFPDHGSPYHGGTRRVVLRRFPYDVVYRSVDAGTHVVALTHHRRTPFYWKQRI
jgi:toxin ParE1/3/4